MLGAELGWAGLSVSRDTACYCCLEIEEQKKKILNSDVDQVYIEFREAAGRNNLTSISDHRISEFEYASEKIPRLNRPVPRSSQLFGISIVYSNASALTTLST